VELDLHIRVTYTDLEGAGDIRTRFKNCIVKMRTDYGVAVFIIVETNELLDIKLLSPSLSTLILYTLMPASIEQFNSILRLCDTVITGTTGDCL
jgi:hypothetical protein